MKLSFFILFFSYLQGFCQVGNTYKNYLHSEFADFFHTTEIKRTAYKNGELRKIKTGGFQEYITIYIYSDTASSTIHEATLEVDRTWLDDATTNDFARDLVKSFMIEFICSSDQNKIAPATQLLFNRKPTQDKFALNLFEVFGNKQISCSQQFSKCMISTENSNQDEKTFFRLKISEAGN